MNKQMIETIGWILFGIVFVIMFFGMFWVLSMSNADIKTSHNITLNTDNQTRDALSYMSKIKEFEIKENDLYCENQLLEQKLQYESALNSQMYYYEVERGKQ